MKYKSNGCEMRAAISPIDILFLPLIKEDNIVNAPMKVNTKKITER